MQIESEESLRSRAASNVSILIEESIMLDTNAEDETPTFDPQECHPGCELGTGGFSIVYQVDSITLNNRQPQDDRVNGRDYLAMNTLKNEHARYAIKTLKNAMIKKATSINEEDRLQFIAGVADLAMEAKYLSVLSHPHIIKMRGMASVHPCSDSFFIVLDRLYDTLQERIDDAWTKKARKFSGGLGFVLDSNGSKKDKFAANRFCVAHDISSVLAYLHSQRIVFRDLKPDNVGFDVRGQVKVFDFGLTREMVSTSEEASGSDSDVYVMSGDVGSLRYMAPEVAKSEAYNHKADIYAFGLVLWQICTLKTPYKELDANNFHEVVIEGGERPKIDEKTAPAPVVRLIERCWSSDLKDRPESNEIMNVLRAEIGAYDETMLGELDVSDRTQMSANANSE